MNFNLFIKNKITDYTYIGLSPTALFIELADGETAVPISEFHADIMEQNITAVSFYGNVMANEEALSWLCPKLIASGCVVTIITDTIVDIAANQVLFVIRYDATKLRGKIANCKSLNGERGDCILLSGTTDEIHRIYRAIKMNEINLPLFFAPVLIVSKAEAVGKEIKGQGDIYFMPHRTWNLNSLSGTKQDKTVLIPVQFATPYIGIY